MAVFKPLVLSATGQIQRLQSGDSISGPVAETEQQSWTNGDAGSHAIGDVVYISAADTAKKAKADASATAPAVAFATAAITNGAVGSYQTSGTLAGLTGLTAGSQYFLSATTAGVMSTTAPSSAGQYVVSLGRAVSTTEFMINIKDPILL